MMSLPHKTEIHPHRLGNPPFADVDRRIRQVRWPIFPSRERRLDVLRIDWPQADAER
jgi:hypothetical protein